MSENYGMKEEVMDFLKDKESKMLCIKEKKYKVVVNNYFMKLPYVGYEGNNIVLPEGKYEMIAFGDMTCRDNFPSLQGQGYINIETGEIIELGYYLECVIGEINSVKFNKIQPVMNKKIIDYIYYNLTENKEDSVFKFEGESYDKIKTQTLELKEQGKWKDMANRMYVNGGSIDDYKIEHNLNFETADYLRYLDDESLFINEKAIDLWNSNLHLREAVFANILAVEEIEKELAEICKNERKDNTDDLYSLKMIKKNINEFNKEREDEEGREEIQSIKIGIEVEVDGKKEVIYDFVGVNMVMNLYDVSSVLNYRDFTKSFRTFIELRTVGKEKYNFYLKDIVEIIYGKKVLYCRETKSRRV